MKSLTVIQQQWKSSEKCPEWKASRVCSPWGFSSLVRTFLSLVLWDAGSQFSCFSQRCTNPQVSLQKHKPVWTGVIFLAAQDLTAQAHAYARTHILTHSKLRCCCWLWWWEESLVVLALPLLCVPSVTFFMDWISILPNALMLFFCLCVQLCCLIHLITLLLHQDCFI